MDPRKHTRNSSLRRALPVLCGLVLFGCSSLPAGPEIPLESEGFSEAIVQAHLENLQRLGARLPGDDRDVAARQYLAREFQRAGLSIEILEDGDHRHLFGVLPGQSANSVLLVAPYASLGTNPWVDDAGPALLLEVARVLARAEPLAYTLQIALADTRPPAPRAGAVQGEAVESDARLAARAEVSRAGESLARVLAERFRVDEVRAVIAFEPRAGVAPRMARDLRSQPVFRSLFWDVAAELGHEAAFPADGGWRSPAGLRAAFQAAGHSQVLALVDETTARVELQAELGLGADPGNRELARLEPIGQVTVEALERLMHRFARIDAFNP